MSLTTPLLSSSPNIEYYPKKLHGCNCPPVILSSYEDDVPTNQQQYSPPSLPTYIHTTQYWKGVEREMWRNIDIRRKAKRDIFQSPESVIVFFFFPFFSLYCKLIYLSATCNIHIIPSILFQYLYLLSQSKTNQNGQRRRSSREQGSWV